MANSPHNAPHQPIFAADSEIPVVPEEMNAIRVHHTGGPEVLNYESVKTPLPGEGEVLVATRAIGINYIDTYFRDGTYPAKCPFIPGQEGAGVIAACGEGVTDFSVGDRVAFYHPNCSYAECVAVPQSSCVAVADDVDDETAASMLLQGMTAHYLANGCYELGPGDTCLITAGAGGVGLLLTQMAKAQGARVITLVSTDEKEQLSREAGADEVLRYEDFTSDKIRELTSGNGVDVAYDGVGKSTFDTSIHSVKVTGTMVLFGAASGPVDPIDPQLLNQCGSIFLTRPSLGHWISRPGEFQSRAQAVSAMVADGTLKFRIGGSYSLAEAKRAHEDLQNRLTTGSIVLIP